MNNPCRIDFWFQNGLPAKYLPNAFNSNIDLTSYPSVTFNAANTETNCFSLPPIQGEDLSDLGIIGGAEPGLQGIASITANDLIIIGPLRVGSITATNLSIRGPVQAQGRLAPNIDINISSPTGGISILDGRVDPYISEQYRVTGIGSMNAPTNRAYSEMKQCYIKHFLECVTFDESTIIGNQNKLTACLARIGAAERGEASSDPIPEPTGGKIELSNSSIGLNISVNAGFVNLRTSSNNGDINSFCKMEAGSTNGSKGRITDLALFKDSTNHGSLSGPMAMFGDGGINVSRSGVSPGKAVFYGGGKNDGVVITESYFICGGRNDSVCSGNGYLYAGLNNGVIVGDVVCSGGVNGGVISGDLTILGLGTTNGIVFGNVNSVSGIVEGVISGNLDAKNSTGAKVSVIDGSVNLNVCEYGVVNVSGGDVNLIETPVSTLNIGYSEKWNISKQIFVKSEYSLSAKKSDISDGMLRVSSANFDRCLNKATISGTDVVFYSGSSQGDIAATSCLFTATSHLQTLNSDNSVFDNRSTNFGAIYSETSQFSNRSANAGQVYSKSTVTFNNFSINDTDGVVTIVEPSTSPVVFNNFSDNYGTVWGDAVFSSKSNNFGTIRGDATFDDTSKNDGIVVGNCYGSGC